jgi:hypothetical protein
MQKAGEGLGRFSAKKRLRELIPFFFVFIFVRSLIGGPRVLSPPPPTLRQNIDYKVLNYKIFKTKDLAECF